VDVRPPNKHAHPRSRRYLIGLVCALGVGCGKPLAGVDTRDLRCGSLPSPSVVELCTKVERELEYTRSGHAMIFGYLGYWCTDATVQKVFCGGANVVLPEVQATLDQASAETLTVDTRLYSCLLGLKRAAEVAALPEAQRDPALEVRCR
jgi:hypothetical protein